MNDSVTQPDINDPFLQDYSGSAYDDFQKDADRDNRLGDQDFLITEKIPGQWDDGRKNVKLNGVLQSANNAKFNMMFTAPPPPDKLASVPQEHKRSTAFNIRLIKDMREHYGVTPFGVEVGTVIRVKVDKDKVDKATGQYYLRGVAIKPKSEIGKPSGVNGTSASTAAKAAEF